SVETLVLVPDSTAPYFKILAGGLFYFSGSPFKAGLARLSASGALDTAFSTAIGAGAHTLNSQNTLQYVNAIAVQRDGKIVIGGSFTAFNTVARDRIARLMNTGALDSSFNPSADDDVRCLLLQADQKIIAGGYFYNMNGATVSHFTRL